MVSIFSKIIAARRTGDVKARMTYRRSSTLRIVMRRIQRPERLLKRGVDSPTRR